MTLKQAREAAGLSQLRLDKLAGLEAGTVNQIELGRNRNPSHVIVVKLARALRKQGLRGVTTETLFPVVDDLVADQSQAVAS